MTISFEKDANSCEINQWTVKKRGCKQSINTTVTYNFPKGISHSDTQANSFYTKEKAEFSTLKFVGIEPTVK